MWEYRTWRRLCLIWILLYLFAPHCLTFLKHIANSLRRVYEIPYEIAGRTVIGNHDTIGYHAVVGVKRQDMKYKGDDCYPHIGKNNDIREYANIHRSSKSNDCTVIGDNNLVMGSCHGAHDCKLGNHNILANGALIGGHVVLEGRSYQLCLVCFKQTLGTYCRKHVNVLYVKSAFTRVGRLQYIDIIVILTHILSWLVAPWSQGMSPCTGD